MRFFIKRGPIDKKGKRYTRNDKYIEMDYEDARPFVRRGQLMLSKTQEVNNVQENSVGSGVSASSKPSASKRGRKKRDRSTQQ